jgi:hypothetical protein
VVYAEEADLEHGEIQVGQNAVSGQDRFDQEVKYY